MTMDPKQLPYFAYGTLLGETHMRSRYPSAASLGTATYPDHELAFHTYGDAGEGGCTIVERPDADLLGVLYTLDSADMSILMAVGGAAEWYERREIEARRSDGSVVRAVTLLVTGDSGPWTPPEPYAELVTSGAREAALPTTYVARLDGIVAQATGGVGPGEAP